jgi:hypothetical protein
MLVLVGIGCSARIGVDLSSRERRGGPEDATAEEAAWEIDGDPGSGEAVVAVGIGDVDGDGVDDVAIGGAPDEYRYGRVLVYAGAAGGPSEEPTTWIAGATIGDGFGRSIARLGDVNLDGYDDIAVGANGDGLWDGAVYIYLGSATGLGTEPSEMKIGRAHV